MPRHGSGTPTVPADTRNFRSPALDLDSVYGDGPVADQRLYDPADGIKFRLESGGLFEDLPRTATLEAIVADPRNDENVIISGLQCAFLQFHNNAVDAVRANGVSDPADAFAEARRLTTWHYQWIVLHEFLPHVVGEKFAHEALFGDSISRRWFNPGPGEAFMPVEFQTGTYRMGHSMVRPSYRANLAGDDGDPFFALVFDTDQEGKPDPDDLRGGCRAPRRFVGWQTFFDFGDGEVKPNKAIDTKISTPLFTLPLGAIASHDLPTSLPQRNLLRHVTWQLPSGQAVAAALGVDALSSADLDELSALNVGLEHSTPLWYYVLKEAELLADGHHLGPVGGRITAQVLVGLLRSDPASFLTVDPAWQPTLPYAGQSFAMTDFLTFAGVDPQTRGQVPIPTGHSDATLRGRLVTPSRRSRTLVLARCPCRPRRPRGRAGRRNLVPRQHCRACLHASSSKVTRASARPRSTRPWSTMLQSGISVPRCAGEEAEARLSSSV